MSANTLRLAECIQLIEVDLPNKSQNGSFVVQVTNERKQVVNNNTVTLYAQNLSKVPVTVDLMQPDRYLLLKGLGRLGLWAEAEHDGVVYGLDEV